TVAAGTQWDLGASTGLTAPGSLLKLEAGNNVTVAAGHVRTVAGGDLTVRTLAGNIATGTKANGFRFLPSSYAVDADLGGIGTANGGDVTLAAGQDVVSFLPLAGGQQGNAGSGAFGAAPGDVTVTAGRDVAGHFVVRHGEGRINAGRNAGTAARLLALSVVDGGWTVDAGQDVLLQEIRNPNGLFNNLGSTASPWKHFFDYAPDAYAALTAGNSVQLRGTALPRYGDAFSHGMPPLYPGTLDITAGAGGVVLGNDVILFPSPVGNLTVTTTGGAALVGTKPGDLAQLVLSDSGRTQYRAFGDFGIADHAAVPVHLDDAEPLRLDISGDLRGVLVGSSKRAEIHVGGDMVNGRFDGQNLRPGDVTRLHVAGDIVNRNEFTSVTGVAEPDFSPFELGLIYPPLTGSLAGLETRFAYDRATGRLTFQGRMTGDELGLLLSTPVRVFDANGLPVLLPNGEPLTRSVQILPPEVANRLYADSQDIPLNPDTGYRLGGGGAFDLRAGSLDLGATAGIVSQGPRANRALAQIFTRGADISLTLDGDLGLFSTRIASQNGGDISIFAGGDVAVGSRDFTADDRTARGIYTVDPSDVTVIARGDINVNGSRIAAYDGGDVTVRSLEGNIDAGAGGQGGVRVERLYVDPETREILTFAPTIRGSGILATTFPRSRNPAIPASLNRVGDITVVAPRGDILANAGGIVQLTLNGVLPGDATVTVNAGLSAKGPQGELLGPDGQPVRTADGGLVFIKDLKPLLDGQGRPVFDAGGHAVVVRRDAAGDEVPVFTADGQAFQPVLYRIEAGRSGIVGNNLRVDAVGDIRGVLVAGGNLDVVTPQNVNVTTVAGGNANVDAGGNISGNIIAIQGLNASGAGIDAALQSQNVTASGEVSGQVGFAAGTAAAATSQAQQAEEPAETLAAASAAGEVEEELKKALPAPRLARTVGRVTVILPGSSQP
ncbi:MAG: hypothetical protein ACKVYV_08040, partial [Limisphaerales bacterium]